MEKDEEHQLGYQKEIECGSRIEPSEYLRKIPEE